MFVKIVCIVLYYYVYDVLDFVKVVECVCIECGLCLMFICVNVLCLIVEVGKLVKVYELLEWVCNGKGVGVDVLFIVYWVLDFLMVNGFVYKFELVNVFVVCYYLSSVQYLVLFLICNSCYSVVELEDCEIVSQLEKCVKELGFQLQVQILEVYGFCVCCVG